MWTYYMTYDVDLPVPSVPLGRPVPDESAVRFEQLPCKPQLGTQTTFKQSVSHSSSLHVFLQAGFTLERSAWTCLG